jgi:hypothetical protein
VEFLLLIATLVVFQIACGKILKPTTESYIDFQLHDRIEEYGKASRYKVHNGYTERSLHISEQWYDEESTPPCYVSPCFTLLYHDALLYHDTLLYHDGTTCHILPRNNTEPDLEQLIYSCVACRRDRATGEWIHGDVSEQGRKAECTEVEIDNGDLSTRIGAYAVIKRDMLIQKYMSPCVVVKTENSYVLIETIDAGTPCGSGGTCTDDGRCLGDTSDPIPVPNDIDSPVDPPQVLLAYIAVLRYAHFCPVKELVFSYRWSPSLTTTDVDEGRNKREITIGGEHYSDLFRQAYNEMWKVAKIPYTPIHIYAVVIGAICGAIVGCLFYNRHRTAV